MKVISLEASASSAALLAAASYFYSIIEHDAPPPGFASPLTAGPVRSGGFSDDQ